MKKFLLFAVAALMVFSFSNTAVCGEGMYMGLNAGLTIGSDSDWTDSTVPGVVVEIESDTGYGIGCALGYEFGNGLRLEAELAYLANDIDKVSLLGVSLPVTGEISSTALLVNGYFDFKNSTPFTPFIGAGVGIATVEMDDFTVVGSGLPPARDDDTVLAGQLSIGCGYAVTEKMSIDLKYRYFVTSDLEMGTSEIEYGNHGVFAGLRFNF